MLLNEIAELQDSTRGLHSATRGLLRISCSNVLAHTRITRLLPKFLDENPQASVEFNLTSRYVVGIVEEGYDVAIRFEAQNGFGADRPPARAGAQLCLRHAGLSGAARPAEASARTWRRIPACSAISPGASAPGRSSGRKSRSTRLWAGACRPTASRPPTR